MATLCALLCALFALPTAATEPLQPHHIQPFIQASGVGSNLIVKISRPWFLQINAARLMHGYPMETLQKVNSDPDCNRHYLFDALRILKNGFEQSKKQPLTLDSLFLLWVAGEKTFSRLNGNPDRLPDPLFQARLRHFRTVLKSEPTLWLPKPLPLHPQKNPLPTNHFRHRLAK